MPIVTDSDAVRTTQTTRFALTAMGRVRNDSTHGPR